MGEMREGEMVTPPAFSNGTEWRIFEEEYCGRCWYDRRAQRDGIYEEGCELIVQAMNRMPVPLWVNKQIGSWTDAEGNEYPQWWVHCLKFTPDDGGPDEGLPIPRPVPPGQEFLFDASVFDWDAPTRVLVEIDA